MKRSHSEPLMAPKLPTLQIFKGRAYELKYRAYRFCLNKKTSKFTLVSWSNFFKTRKNYYIPEICKNLNITTQNASKTQPLNSLYVDLSLRCRDARHIS